MRRTGRNTCIDATFSASLQLSHSHLRCCLAVQSASRSRSKSSLWEFCTLVSFDSFDGSGAKIPNMEGSNLKGQSVFADNGRMSVQMISEFPKLASNDRLKTTTAEEKAVAHGILSYFGSYTVNEANKTVSLNIQRSSFPNQVASSVKRVATFTGDDRAPQPRPVGRWPHRHGVAAGQIGLDTRPLCDGVRASGAPSRQHPARANNREEHP